MGIPKKNIQKILPKPPLVKQLIITNVYENMNKIKFRKFQDFTRFQTDFVLHDSNLNSIIAFYNNQVITYSHFIFFMRCNNYSFQFPINNLNSKYNL